jgi:alpha-tubulin suppressor-like RCC1 family protein
MNPIGIWYLASLIHYSTDKKLLDFSAPYSCEIPTILKLPVKVRSVVSAGHACHTIAIMESGEVYGWGRNEQGNLGSTMPQNVFSPTQLSGVPDGNVQSAAVGKGHSLLLIDGAIYAIGSNKVGQCGLSGVTEQVQSFRKVKFSGDDEPTIVQIACGEAFSVALSDEGHIYTTGSAEYGCLGNGATGEHFITANKLAFANSHAFTKRTTFCYAPTEQVHKNNDSTIKVVPLEEDIRIQAIACGKCHTVALEAQSPDATSRVFTWGNGNYGVLGHGVQADEYRPRLVGALSRGVAGAKFVTAGQTCNLLLTQQGHVYYWGKHRTMGEATMRPTLIDALANNHHVVTTCSAGGQTVVCSTSSSQTVAWGMGYHGELGLGSKKSSSKPTFVETLDGVQVLDVACGYGHTVYVVDPASAKTLKSIDAAKETAKLVT